MNLTTATAMKKEKKLSSVQNVVLMLLVKPEVTKMDPKETDYSIEAFLIETTNGKLLSCPCCHHIFRLKKKDVVDTVIQQWNPDVFPAGFEPELPRMERGDCDE